MKAESQADNKFCLIFWKRKNKTKMKKVAIRVCAKGDSFCIEGELDMKMSHTRFIDLSRSEFSLHDSQALVVTKLPDILIGNDRDVKRLRNGDQVEFYIVNDQSTYSRLQLTRALKNNGKSVRVSECPC